MQIEEIRERISEELFSIWSASNEIDSINDTIDFFRTFLSSIVELRLEYKDDLKTTERIDKRLTKMLPNVIDGLTEIKEIAVAQVIRIRECIQEVKSLLLG